MPRPPPNYFMTVNNDGKLTFISSSKTPSNFTFACIYAVNIKPYGLPVLGLADVDKFVGAAASPPLYSAHSCTTYVLPGSRNLIIS